MIVMPGLVPGIHAFTCAGTAETWMAGTRPDMTGKGYALSAGLAQKRRRGNGFACRPRPRDGAAGAHALGFELAAGGLDVAGARRSDRRRIASLAHNVGKRLDRLVRRAVIKRAAPW